MFESEEIEFSGDGGEGIIFLVDGTTSLASKSESGPEKVSARQPAETVKKHPKKRGENKWRKIDSLRFQGNHVYTEEPREGHGPADFYFLAFDQFREVAERVERNSNTFGDNFDAEKNRKYPFFDYSVSKRRLTYCERSNPNDIKLLVFDERQGAWCEQETESETVAIDRVQYLWNPITKQRFLRKKAQKSVWIPLTDGTEKHDVNGGIFREKEHRRKGTSNREDGVEREGENGEDVDREKEEMHQKVFLWGRDTAEINTASPCLFMCSRTTADENFMIMIKNSEPTPSNIRKSAYHVEFFDDNSSCLVSLPNGDTIKLTKEDNHQIFWDNFVNEHKNSKKGSVSHRFFISLPNSSCSSPALYVIEVSEEVGERGETERRGERGRRRGSEGREIRCIYPTDEIVPVIAEKRRDGKKDFYLMEKEKRKIFPVKTLETSQVVKFDIKFDEFFFDVERDAQRNKWKVSPLLWRLSSPYISCLINNTLHWVFFDDRVEMYLEMHQKYFKAVCSYPPEFRETLGSTKLDKSSTASQERSPKKHPFYVLIGGHQFFEIDEKEYREGEKRKHFLMGLGREGEKKEVLAFFDGNQRENWTGHLVTMPSLLSLSPFEEKPVFVSYYFDGDWSVIACQHTSRSQVLAKKLHKTMMARDKFDNLMTVVLSDHSQVIAVVQETGNLGERPQYQILMGDTKRLELREHRDKNLYEIFDVVANISIGTCKNNFNKSTAPSKIDGNGWFAISDAKANIFEGVSKKYSPLLFLQEGCPVSEFVSANGETAPWHQKPNAISLSHQNLALSIYTHQVSKPHQKLFMWSQTVRTHFLKSIKKKSLYYIKNSSVKEFDDYLIFVSVARPFAPSQNGEKASIDSCLVLRLCNERLFAVGEESSRTFFDAIHKYMENSGIDQNFNIKNLRCNEVKRKFDVDFLSPSLICVSHINIRDPSQGTNCRNWIHSIDFVQQKKEEGRGGGNKDEKRENDRGAKRGREKEGGEESRDKRKMEMEYYIKGSKTHLRDKETGETMWSKEVIVGRNKKHQELCCESIHPNEKIFVYSYSNGDIEWRRHKLQMQVIDGELYASKNDGQLYFYSSAERTLLKLFYINNSFFPLPISLISPIKITKEEITFHSKFDATEKKISPVSSSLRQESPLLKAAKPEKRPEATTTKIRPEWRESESRAATNVSFDSANTNHQKLKNSGKERQFRESTKYDANFQKTIALKTVKEAFSEKEVAKKNEGENDIVREPSAPGSTSSAEEEVEFSSIFGNDILPGTYFDAVLSPINNFLHYFVSVKISFLPADVAISDIKILMSFCESSNKVFFSICITNRPVYYFCGDWSQFQLVREKKVAEESKLEKPSKISVLKVLSEKGEFDETFGEFDLRENLIPFVKEVDEGNKIFWIGQKLDHTDQNLAPPIPSLLFYGDGFPEYFDEFDTNSSEELRLISKNETAGEERRREVTLYLVSKLDGTFNLLGRNFLSEENGDSELLSANAANYRGEISLHLSNFDASLINSNSHVIVSSIILHQELPHQVFLLLPYSLLSENASKVYILRKKLGEEEWGLYGEREDDLLTRLTVEHLVGLFYEAEIVMRKTAVLSCSQFSLEETQAMNANVLFLHQNISQNIQNMKNQQQLFQKLMYPFKSYELALSDSLSSSISIKISPSQKASIIYYRLYLSSGKGFFYTKPRVGRREEGEVEERDRETSNEEVELEKATTVAFIDFNHRLSFVVWGENEMRERKQYLLYFDEKIQNFDTKELSDAIIRQNLVFDGNYLMGRKILRKELNESNFHPFPSLNVIKISKEYYFFFAKARERMFALEKVARTGGQRDMLSEREGEREKRRILDNLFMQNEIITETVLFYANEIYVRGDSFFDVFYKNLDFTTEIKRLTNVSPQLEVSHKIYSTLLYPHQILTLWERESSRELLQIENYKVLTGRTIYGDALFVFFDANSHYIFYTRRKTQLETERETAAKVRKEVEWQRRNGERGESTETQLIETVEILLSNQDFIIRVCSQKQIYIKKKGSHQDFVLLGEIFDNPHKSKYFFDKNQKLLPCILHMGEEVGEIQERGEKQALEERNKGEYRPSCIELHTILSLQTLGEEKEREIKKGSRFFRMPSLFWDGETSQFDQSLHVPVHQKFEPQNVEHEGEWTIMTSKIGTAILRYKNSRARNDYSANVRIYEVTGVEGSDINYVSLLSLVLETSNTAETHPRRRILCIFSGLDTLFQDSLLLSSTETWFHYFIKNSQQNECRRDCEHRDRCEHSIILPHGSSFFDAWTEGDNVFARTKSSDTAVLLGVLKQISCVSMERSVSYRWFDQAQNILLDIKVGANDANETCCETSIIDVPIYEDYYIHPVSFAPLSPSPSSLLYTPSQWKTEVVELRDMSLREMLEGSEGETETFNEEGRGSERKGASKLREWRPQGENTQQGEKGESEEKNERGEEGGVRGKGESGEKSERGEDGVGGRVREERTGALGAFSYVYAAKRIQRFYRNSRKSRSLHKEQHKRPWFQDPQLLFHK